MISGAESSLRHGAAGDDAAEGRVEQRFAARAAAAPDALAVAGPDEALSYGQLERRANQLANRLRRLGVADGLPVGLCLERSAGLVVGALGILKAGGAYVALDPSHPVQRLRFMLADSGAAAVVTSAGLATQLEGATAAVVALDADRAELDQEPAAAPTTVARADELAYVVYTSGSTGRPKGVLVEHASLLNLVAWHRRAFAVEPTDRATQVASPGFDATVWELWPYLTAGASIHVPADEVRADAAALREWLLAERITVSFLPTALAEAVITLAWPASAELRYLLTGGDALHHHPPPHLPFTLVNNYGPAEAAVVATSGVVSPCANSLSPPSIGRPIPNVSVHIVDAELRPVAPGAPGELLIGGRGLARGYLNRPDLTAESFIPDRLGGEPGNRLYRTGDRVRERLDGDIEFLGRLDDQVEIRGQRIELGEVSATLDGHSAVRSSVVVASQPTPGETQLLAYVVPAGDHRPDTEGLRSHLAAHLPSAMIPAAFVWLDELPLTRNGKVDRAALPSPTHDNTARPAPSARPRNDLEAALEAIVAELLGLEAVGIDENFFMLGGHSLLGAQLIARIGDRFGVEMALRSLFDKPTVAEIADEVERLLVADLEAMSDEAAARALAGGATTGAA